MGLVRQHQYDRNNTGQCSHWISLSAGLPGQFHMHRYFLELCVEFLLSRNKFQHSQSGRHGTGMEYLQSLQNSILWWGLSRLLAGINHHIQTEITDIRPWISVRYNRNKKWNRMLIYSLLFSFDKYTNDFAARHCASSITELQTKWIEAVVLLTLAMFCFCSRNFLLNFSKRLQCRCSAITTIKTTFQLLLMRKFQ